MTTESKAQLFTSLGSFAFPTGTKGKEATDLTRRVTGVETPHRIHVVLDREKERGQTLTETLFKYSYLFNTIVSGIMLSSEE